MLLQYGRKSCHWGMAKAEAAQLGGVHLTIWPDLGVQTWPRGRAQSHSARNLWFYLRSQSGSESAGLCGRHRYMEGAVYLLGRWSPAWGSAWVQVLPCTRALPSQCQLTSSPSRCCSLLCQSRRVCRPPVLRLCFVQIPPHGP